MNSNDTTQEIPEGPIGRTSKHIAFFLLTLYAITLVVVLITAIIEEPSDNRIWFDLFKSGFLILGGSLTTVIGYYFGSRGVQEAETSAAIALQEAKRANEELKKEKEKGRKEKEEHSPTYDENSLIEPNDEEKEDS